MTNNLKQIEEFLGKEYINWTNEDLLEIITDEDKLLLLTPELVIHIREELKLVNEAIEPAIQAIYYGAKVQTSHRKTDGLVEQLAEEQIDIKTFNEEMLKLTESVELFDRFYAYTTLANTNTEVDLKGKEEDIKDVVATVIDIIGNINIQSGFQVVIELVDTLFILKETYGEIHQVDLVGDNPLLEEVLEELDEISQMLVEEYGIDEETEEWDE